MNLSPIRLKKYLNAAELFQNETTKEHSIEEKVYPYEHMNILPFFQSFATNKNFNCLAYTYVSAYMYLAYYNWYENSIFFTCNQNV